MPRKYLKRIMPDKQAMRDNPYLKKFGKRLTEPKLWHLNRRSVSMGLALGLFIGFMPILGQIFVAAALAIIFRANLPVAVMAVWISNPLTLAPLYYFAYKVGAWVLDIPVGAYAFTMSWEWFTSEFLLIWQPLILGCVICGVVASTAGAILFRIIWRLMVMKSWSDRRFRVKKDDDSPSNNDSDV